MCKMAKFHLFCQVLFFSCHCTGSQSYKRVDPMEFILDQLGKREQSTSIMLFSSSAADLRDIRSMALKANVLISFHNGSAKFTKPYDEVYWNFGRTIAFIFPATVKDAIEVISAVTRTDKTGSQFRWTPTVITVLDENCRSGLKTCTAAELIGNVSSLNKMPSMSEDIFIVEYQMENNSWYSTAIRGGLGNKMQVLRHQQLPSRDPIWNHQVSNGGLDGAELVTGVPRWGFLVKEEFTYSTEGNMTELTGGLAFHLLKYLQDSLNFTTKFLYANPSKPADIDNLHGFGKHLMNGITDFHLMKTTHLVSRKENFTFLMPHFTDNMEAYFVQPPVSSVRNIYVEPFQAKLWVAVVVVFAILWVSFLLVTSHNGLRERAKCTAGLDVGVLWTISCITVQGWHKDPDEFSTKTVHFVGSTLGLVLSIAFSAAVVSALSVPQVAVNDFNGLLTSQFKFTHMQESLTMRDLLARTDGGSNADIPGQQLAAFRERVVNVPDNVVGISMIFSSRTAFVSFLESFNTISKNRLNISNDDICEKVSKVPVSRRRVHSGMMLNKTSPLKEFFNSALIRMVERGMLFKFKKDYLRSFYGGCGKYRNRDDDDAGLGMADVFSAFLFLGATQIIVFGVLAVESVYSKRLLNE